MAYGNVLGYTPGPQPGTYAFQQANGQSTLLAGAPAENLKAKLDASSALAGQKVAGPGGGAPADQMMSEPAPAMSVAPNASAMPNEGQLAVPTPPPPAAGPQFRATPTGAPAEGVPGSIAAPQAAPPSSAYTVNGINTGLVQGPDNGLYKRVAASPGVTQAQLQAKAATGVATPHSASESTTGGFAPSQQFLDEREKLAQEKGGIIDKTAEVERQNAEREQALAAQQFKDAAALKAEEQARTDAIATRLQKDEQTKDQLVKEYGNAKVNPNRLFSGPGGGARAIGAALAAGLGAAGTGLQAMGGHPGQPNLAFQAIQSGIDRDISAQENEIKVKGAMADNALAQFTRTGLSLDQAKAALRASQLQWAAAQNQQASSLSKGALVDVNAAAMHNALSGAINDANEDYRQKSLGTSTKAVASQVVYPHAGSAGGLVRLTPDEAMKVGERAVETGGKVATTAETLNKIEHPKNPTAAKQQGSLADIEAAQQQLQKAAASAGLTFKDGKFEGEGHSVYAEGALAGEKSHKYVADLRAAAPSVAAALGEKRLSQAEFDNWAGNASTRSGEANKDFLQGQFEALEARKRALAAGGGGVAESPAPVESEAAP